MSRLITIFLIITFLFACKDHKPVGETSFIMRDYYNDGTIMRIQEFNKDSIEHGLYRFYHPNGVLADSANAINGYIHGERYEFYDTGDLYTYTRYTNKNPRNYTIYGQKGKVLEYGSYDYFGNLFFRADYDSLENVAGYESTHNSMLLHNFFMKDSVPVNQYFDIELLVSDPINATTEVAIKDWDAEINDWVFSKKVKPDDYNRVRLKRKRFEEKEMYILGLARMDSPNGYVLEDTLLIHIDKFGYTSRADVDRELMNSFFGG